MDVMTYVFAGSMVLITIGLLSFLFFINIQHKKQIDELTSKIVARTLPEYVASQKKVEVKPPEPKDQIINDPLLGPINITKNKRIL